ncbi:MAG TPA: hypothetical protein VJT78_07090, partial [Candidatus Dormibacteraeota bacterium]|nr:hypothetical protein [Candidatus Dormibacteraeota bacterium]
MADRPLVAHRITGRVRFELPYRMLEPRRRSGIAAALAAERGVIRHRFNPGARSLVVEHTPGVTVARLERLIGKAPKREPGAPKPPSRAARR